MQAEIQAAKGMRERNLVLGDGVSESPADSPMVSMTLPRAEFSDRECQQAKPSMGGLCPLNEYPAVDVPSRSNVGAIGEERRGRLAVPSW